MAIAAADQRLPLSCAGFIKAAGGILPVDCPGVENVNLSNVIDGHFDYVTKIDDIMHAISL